MSFDFAVAMIQANVKDFVMFVRYDRANEFVEALAEYTKAIVNAAIAAVKEDVIKLLDKRID